jgi:hypothetical protein
MGWVNDILKRGSLMNDDPDQPQAEKSPQRSRTISDQTPSARDISDGQFIRQVRELVAAKSYLYEAGVRFEEEHLQAVDLSELQVLRYYDVGRPATAAEWSKVNSAARNIRSVPYTRTVSAKTDPRDASYNRQFAGMVIMRVPLWLCAGTRPELAAFCPAAPTCAPERVPRVDDLVRRPGRRGFPCRKLSDGAERCQLRYC